MNSGGTIWRASQSMERQTDRHIVLYIGSLQKGGAERVMGNLAEYFYRQGFRVSFVTTYFHPPEYVLPDAAWDAETGEASADRPGIRRLYSDPDPALLREGTIGRIHNFRIRLKTLRDLFRSLQPDLILSFSGKNNLMAVAASRGLKRGSGRQVPCVVSVRSNPSREYGGRAMKWCAFVLFRKAEGVVLQTKGALEFFPKAVRDKAVILPNSIHPDFMQPLAEGPREKTVVLVGRLDDNKNEALAVRAFAGTRTAHPEYRMNIYGSGPEEDKLRDLVRELGLSGSVTLCGSVPDVASCIRKAQIFILPSKQEGMPNALIEAMSLGLACISTDCPCYGPRDLIRDGENGFLVPVDDVHAMTDRLLCLMDDPALCGRMGACALGVREHYSPERINLSWRRYFESLMK